MARRQPTKADDAVLAYRLSRAELTAKITAMTATLKALSEIPR